MKTLALALALSIAPTWAFANDPYTPARASFSPDALAASIESRPSAAAVLYCQADITEKGRVARSACFDKRGDANLEHNAQVGLKTLAFSPATVEGQSVPVRMNFRLAFNGGSVHLIPNLGTMQSRYGRDYIAPQERLDKGDWQEKYVQSSWVNGTPFLGEGEQSRVAATVDARGRAETVRLLEAERAYARDAKLVKHALRTARFIPGFVNGRAVPMGYVAVVHYGDGQQAVAEN